MIEYTPKKNIQNFGSIVYCWPCHANNEWQKDMLEFMFKKLK